MLFLEFSENSLIVENIIVSREETSKLEVISKQITGLLLVECQESPELPVALALISAEELR